MNKSEKMVLSKLTCVLEIGVIFYVFRVVTVRFQPHHTMMIRGVLKKVLSVAHWTILLLTEINSKGTSCLRKRLTSWLIGGGKND